MRAGSIEQIDTTEAVFEQPATAYVADFLGGMSLVRGKVDDDHLVLASGARLSLPRGCAAGSWGLGSEALIGFRPEDVRIGKGDVTSLRLRGSRGLVELLGRERLAHVDLGGQEIRMRLAGPVDPVAALDTHVGAEVLHVFCPVTGARLGDGADQRSDDAGRPTPGWADTTTPSVEGDGAEAGAVAE